MAEYRYPTVLYDSGQRKNLGALWADFPLVWQLERAIAARTGPLAPSLHFVSYPENNVLVGFGAPRCLHPSGSWGWVQVIEVGGFEGHGWWLVDCYDVEELVRWIRGASLPGRRYELRRTSFQ